MVFNGRLRVRYPISANHIAPSAVRLTVGTLASHVTSAGPPGTGNLAYWSKEGLGGVPGKGGCVGADVLVRARLSVVVLSAKEVLARLWVGCGFSAQEAVIIPTRHKESRGGNGVGVPGAGVAGVRFEEAAGTGDGLDVAGKGGLQEPFPVGPVLSQRDQALNALKMLAKVLGPVVGAQVVGMVEGLSSQKPASPVPATPSHAETVARLNGRSGC